MKRQKVNRVPVQIEVDLDDLEAVDDAAILISKNASEILWQLMNTGGVEPITLDLGFGYGIHSVEPEVAKYILAIYDLLNGLLSRVAVGARVHINGGSALSEPKLVKKVRRVSLERLSD